MKRIVKSKKPDFVSKTVLFQGLSQSAGHGQAFQAVNAGLRALDLDNKLVGGVARSIAANLI